MNGKQKIFIAAIVIFTCTFFYTLFTADIRNIHYYENTSEVVDGVTMHYRASISKHQIYMFGKYRTLIKTNHMIRRPTTSIEEIKK